MIQLTAEESLKIENKERAKYFCKNNIQNLKNKDSVEKNSPLFIFVPRINENKLLPFCKRLQFSNLFSEGRHLIISSEHSLLAVLICAKRSWKNDACRNCCNLVKNSLYILDPQEKTIDKKHVIPLRTADQIKTPSCGDKVNEPLPFSIRGLDYTGPFYVKNLNKISKIPHSPWSLAELADQYI